MVQQTFEETKKLVWPEIKKYLKDPIYPKDFLIPKKYVPDIKYNWKIANEYPERLGKYLRPTLVLLVSKAMGLDEKYATKTASAMQISEEWLLVHDDIEDHSDLRRGKPALHKLYSPELAINAGDFLHVIMWKVLQDNQKIIGIDKTFSILDEFYKMLLRTIHGQGTEIAWSETSKFSYSDKDWYFIADGKTAYYTISGPLRLGAILAGANSKQIETLTNFGLKLGRCFQLVDDLLDITTSYKGVGQKIGNDVLEGKRTLILGHLLRNATEEDNKKIVSILRKNRDTKKQSEVDWIIRKMNDYKSIEYAKEIAKKYKEEAMQIFEKDLKFLSKEPARSKLGELIEFILERKH